MIRPALLTLAICLCGSWGLAADPYGGIDPYWMLLHEPVAVAELKLNPTQGTSYRATLDELDLQFFPLRNKPEQEAKAGLEKIVATAREQLAKTLKAEQVKRLDEILLQRLGTAAFRQEEFLDRLKLGKIQRKAVVDHLDEVQKKVAALEKQASEGKPRETLDQEFLEFKTREQKRLNELLQPAQLAAWRESLGRTFDLSKLGQPAMKAPEIVDSGEWIGATKPVKLADLRGKVVIVHFYAANCINCIRNFPTYREWQERFKGQDVVILGIHTPETADERNVAAVRQKAGQEKFAFPVCIDGQNANWNAWGNSMWPSVYLLDKRGYVRTFWPGELKWQGATGDEQLAKRIEALLAEDR